MTRLQSHIRALQCKIDWSDYVLISTAILKELLGETIHNQLIQIQQLYLDNQSNAAIQMVLDVCKQHSEINIFELIITKATDLDNDPMLLDSRRYFETKYSQLLWQSMGNEEFKSIQKLADLMYRKNPKIVGPNQINSIESAAITIGIMRQYSEFTPASEDRADEISKLSELYKRKDRGIQSKSTFFSTNSGIMRSITPCPVESQHNLRINRTPDLFTINREIEKGFSSSRTDVPFVNSISGTAFAFLSVLEALLKEQQHQPHDELQADVNYLLKAFLCYTSMNGYHSLEEMIAVYKEPEIISFFSKYNLHFDLNFPHQVLEKLFDNAKNYAIKVILQKEVNKEIKRSPFLNLRGFPIKFPSSTASSSPNDTLLDTKGLGEEKIWKKIFNYALTDLASISKASQVNKKWNQFINKEFPIHLAHRLFPDLAIKMAKRMSGGWTNTTMLIDSSRGTLVGRFPGKNSNDFINRDAESKNIQIAYQLGFFPEIIDNKQKGVLLTRYLNNPQTMTPELLKKPYYLEQTVKALKLLHESNKNFVNNIDVFERNDCMLNILSSHKIILPSTFHEMLKELEKVRTIINQLHIRKVPCHNDACPGNFIESNGVMKLIDLEYAGNNDLLWDLVSLSNEGAFSEAQNKEMFRVYFGAEPNEEIIHRFTLYTAVYVCWAYLWARVQLANQNLPYGSEVLYEIGNLRLDELTTIIKSNEFQDALVLLSSEEDSNESRKIMIIK